MKALWSFGFVVGFGWANYSRQRPRGDGDGDVVQVDSYLQRESKVSGTVTGVKVL